VLTYILNLWIRDLGQHVDPKGDQPVSKVSRGKVG